MFVGRLGMGVLRRMMGLREEYMAVYVISIRYRRTDNNQGWCIHAVFSSLNLTGHWRLNMDIDHETVHHCTVEVPIACGFQNTEAGSYLILRATNL